MNDFHLIQVYREYSKDIWDYLIHMPYMPSRYDRDVLLKCEDKKRVRIWDYFFRIKPEDVGIPQQQEIQSLKDAIDNEIVNHNQKVRNVNSSINDIKKKAGQERIRKLGLGFGSLIMVLGLVYYFLETLNLDVVFAAACISPVFLYGLIMLVSVVVLGVNERMQIGELKRQIRRLSDQNKEKVDITRKRIRVLESCIRELLMQIPVPPSDKEVRRWLTEDFGELWERSKDATGLGTRLLNIKDLMNPITVLGPGELQHTDRIPPQYTPQIKPDLNKHLTARRAYYSENEIEVLYGVYYLEHILIADDMLATNGLFYDFITGKESSEQTTEQYYKDVVAIATTKEFRKIPIDASGQDMIFIDDAPTFTLSLADGEKRTVTFVNEKYFKEIKEKINIPEDKITQIYWIRDSEKTAENAIKALRYRLRIHKGAFDEDFTSKT